MRYSFIIPTYNNKKLLENTLAALEYQTGFGKAQYEVVVVDDGSSDRTFEIIQKDRNYLLKYIFLERSENSGRARARNYGWKNAEGEIVIFIDSDIIVRRDYLTYLSACYRREENMVVLGPRLMLQQDVNQEDIADANFLKKFRFDLSQEEYFEHRHYVFNLTSFNMQSMKDPWLYAYSCNMAIPKKLIEKAGGFDQVYKGWGVEDLELGYKLFRTGIKIIYHDKLETLHQYHPPSADLDAKNAVANAEYFIAKYPHALEEFPHDLKRLLLIGSVGSAERIKKMDDEIEHIAKKIIPFMTDGAKPSKTEVIEFKEASELKEVKRKIEQLSKNKELEIIVNDYVEDTDLGIWIQLLENAESVPRYYLMSKRFRFRDL